MFRRDPIEILRDDIEIPELVQKKADEALHMILGQEKNIPHNDRQRKKVSNFSKKKIGILIAAAILVFGTLTVAAAYIRWSRSLSDGLQATEKQKVELEETHMSTFVDQVSEDQGIRVTAMQSITDNYYTHIAFKVEGYRLDEGMQPEFEKVDVTVDGQENISKGSDFYDGIVRGTDGELMNADGTPVDYDEEGGILKSYMMDDGSMEYQITLVSAHKKGFFINKPIHVEFHNLGIVERSEYTNRVDGTWSFDWNLEGSGKIRESEVKVALGDSGATVMKVGVSSISIFAQYEFPRTEVTIKGLDENGEEMDMKKPGEPPMLTGIKMRDGTIYPYVYLGPGGTGYESEESDLYKVSFAIDRIIDVDEVEALLFVKSHPEEGERITEENFYTVPL